VHHDDIHRKHHHAGDPVDDSLRNINQNLLDMQ
jgi:hypothetical protein